VPVPGFDLVNDDNIDDALCVRESPPFVRHAPWIGWDPGVRGR
jgi:hypothetical protein